MKYSRRRQLRCLLFIFIIATLGFTFIFDLSLSYDENYDVTQSPSTRWRLEIEKSTRRFRKVLAENAKRFTTSSALTHHNHGHDFRYIIENRDACKGDRIIFIGVMSAPRNYKQRQSIRTTWATGLSKNSSIRVLFFIGLPSDQQTQKMLHDENDLNADIIQEEFVDSYQNLTLKTIMFMKWITIHCEDLPPLVVKCDDDVFVHLPLLLNISTEYILQPKTMFGWLLENTTRMENPKHKFYVSDQEYEDKIYPPYLAGPLYAMTGDCVPELYDSSLRLPQIPMEDVFITGICAQDANLSLKTEELINTNPEFPWPSCQLLSHAIRHEATPSDMKRMWIHFQDPCPDSMLGWARHWFNAVVELISNLDLVFF